MSGVELVKIIREKIGLNPWNMSKRMGKAVQSYLSLERKADRISLPDLDRLEEIFLEEGGTSEEFKRIQKKCAKKDSTKN